MCLKIKEVIDSDSYRYGGVLKKVLDRIDSKTSTFNKVVYDDYVGYSMRDIEFARIYAMEDGVNISVEVFYDRIIDLSNQCIVDRFNGFNECDIVTFKIRNPMDIQYGISLFDQAHTYIKRLKL